MNTMFFFFEPLRFRRFVDVVRNVYDSITLRGSYLSWVSEFCRKSRLFYLNQYRAHSSIIWLEFCQTKNIPDYEHPSNFGLETEWDEWKDLRFLNSHYDKSQEMIASLSRLEKEVDREFDSDAILSNVEIIPSKVIDTIWFNDLVHSPPEVIAKLKSLDYERYLQTEHWRRIRAAMFLINKAICQYNDCNIIGESWYGGSESGLEVHHLTYLNRGNERFDDLVLLCTRHHELIHSEENPQG